MLSVNRQQVRALAGIFQAAALVQQYAHQGNANPLALATSMRSILIVDASDAESIFGPSSGLGVGFKALMEQLDSNQRDIEITRYTITLIKIESKLANMPPLLARIREGVVNAQRQSAHFDVCHHSVLESLGETYAETASTLQPRVMVHGNPLHLEQATCAARIRAILLAGIRAATLWRQLGGSQWQLILRRGRIVSVARDLMQERDEMVD